MDLNKLAKANDAAIATFTELSSRERWGKYTNVNRFHKKLRTKYGKIDYKELLSVFRELESNEMGSLVFGRGGNPTKFIWTANLKDVARAAQGDIPQMAIAPAVSRGEPKAKPTTIETINKSIGTAFYVVNAESGQSKGYHVSKTVQQCVFDLLDLLEKQSH